MPVVRSRHRTVTTAFLRSGVKHDPSDTLDLVCRMHANVQSRDSKAQCGNKGEWSAATTVKRCEAFSTPNRVFIQHLISRLIRRLDFCHSINDDKYEMQYRIWRSNGPERAREVNN